jgi:trigger factor
MQVELQQISPVLVELRVELDASLVSSEYERAFKEVSKKARIKGFRPGKAPRSVVRQVFGQRIDAEVIQKLVDESFPRAAAEKKMQPVTAPAVEPAAGLSSGKPFSYKARVEVLPGIESVSYEGLEAARPSVEVAEEAIDQELEAIRRANSTLATPSEARASRDGDVVTCDIAAFVGGVLVEDAGTEGFPVELGAGQVFPEIEKGLVGVKVGDKVDVEVAMPEAHPHPRLKGQTAKFLVTVKELKERVLPPADDDLAKDLGDFATLAELRADIRRQLEATQKEQSDNVLAERLVKALVEANPIPVPPSLVAQQMRVSEREILMRAQSQGMSARAVGEQLREQIKADSETKVRAGLLMAEIAKKESLQIGSQQIEDGLKELAEQTGKNVAKLRAEYSEPRKREMLVGMILENKVLDIIEAKAKISAE